jgi:hypothetical protein
MFITILAPWSAEQLTVEEIAREAYAIYLAKGARDGHDLDDWLEAERRLLGQRRNAALQGDDVAQPAVGEARQRHTRPAPDRRRTPRPIVPKYRPV